MGGALLLDEFGVMDSVARKQWLDDPHLYIVHIFPTVCCADASRNRNRCISHLLSALQIFPPALGGQVQIRGLAQRADSVAGARVAVVVRGAVPHAAVVPDGQIILAPLEADLCVVILGDNVDQVAQQEV